MNLSLRFCAPNSLHSFLMSEEFLTSQLYLVGTDVESMIQ